MITLKDLDVAKKRVFVRGDLDVPLEKRQVKINKESDGEEEIIVEDDSRLENLVSTIRFLLGRNNQVILAGHIGRPQESKDFSLSTKSILTDLSQILNIKVIHFPALDKLIIPKNSLGLLENLRFWEGEENNDEEFARQLASLANVYVNEAFAASHREHASIVGVPKFLPHAAGFHFAKEVEVLTGVLKNPKTRNKTASD